MILAVLTAVLLIVFVLRLAKRPGAKVNLGEQEFALGKDVVFAARIAEHGPLIFAPLRGSITLYVQHLGPDVAHGWLAFGAHPPLDAANCFVMWRPATHDFIDPCNQALYPADGRGLAQYATRVDPTGAVIINLRESVGTVPPVEITTTTSPAAPAATTPASTRATTATPATAATPGTTAPAAATAPPAAAP
jgi:hypothetical protein